MGMTSTSILYCDHEHRYFPQSNNVGRHITKFGNYQSVIFITAISIECLDVMGRASEPSNLAHVAGRGLAAEG
jgi:hypothetical protein